MEKPSNQGSQNQPSGDLPATCLITKIKVQSAPDLKEVGWLVKLMNQGMESEGFVSAELIPPFPPEQNEWRLMQRFRTPEQVLTWSGSSARQKLLKEMADDCPGIDKTHIVDEEVSGGERGSVATAIVTKVKSGMENAYRDWEEKVQLAQAKLSGYRGSYVQAPTSKAHSQWTTMLRFDTPDTLEKWFNCEERLELLKEGSQYVDSVDYKTLSNSFPGWFPTDPQTGKGPAVYKTFLLVLLGLYPIVMCEIKFLNPLLHNLNPALANFIGNCISVAATTWITVPAFIKFFDWWVMPADDEHKTSKEIKGNLILALIFICEIAALWHLLS